MIKINPFSKLLPAKKIFKTRHFNILILSKFNFNILIKFLNTLVRKRNFKNLILVSNGVMFFLKSWIIDKLA